MNPLCIPRTAGLAVLCVCVSSAHADSLYPTYDTTARWYYSDEHTVIDMTPIDEGPNGFSVEWTNPSLPISVSNHTVLNQVTELGGKTGHFLGFDSTVSHTGIQGEFYTFSMWITGTFSEDYEPGQRFLFHILPDGLNWGSADLVINENPKMSAEWSLGETPTITWDMDENYAGQWWGISIGFGNEFDGSTDHGQIWGGVGTYMPIPGPGIAMACAVGLAGIKRRRRRQ